MAKKPTAKRPKAKSVRTRASSSKATRSAAPARAGRKRISAMTSGYRVTSNGGFPNVSNIQPPDQCQDINVPGLGHNATSDAERHQALDYAVTTFWAGAEISAIRRVESSPNHKWVMWLRSDVPPA